LYQFHFVGVKSGNVNVLESYTEQSCLIYVYKCDSLFPESNYFWKLYLSWRFSFRLCRIFLEFSNPTFEIRHHCQCL